MLGSWLRSEMN